MNDNTEFRDVRLFYNKVGRARYISHLDVMRAFQRAFKRSKIECWYTEGFHPHLYLTFALPLSLGYESYCESVDFRVLSDITYKEIEEKLASVFPEGFEVIKAAKPIMQAKEIKYADYNITFECPVDIKNLWTDCFSRENVTVVKKTKSGEKEIDIRDGINLTEILDDNGFYSFSARLLSGTENNINPDLLFNAFESFSGIHVSSKRVTRISVYNEKMQKFR